MTPYKQLLQHDPDNGVYGDCYRTALACLLDEPPQDIPHFNDQNNDMWQVDSDAWLERRGLLMIRLVTDGQSVDVALAEGKVHVPYSMFYMVVGDSPRGVGHNVIAHEDRIVHDPSTYPPDSRGPIIGPHPDTGFFHIEYLVGIPPLSTYSTTEIEDRDVRDSLPIGSSGGGD